MPSKVSLESDLSRTSSSITDDFPLVRQYWTDKLIQDAELADSKVNAEEVSDSEWDDELDLEDEEDERYLQEKGADAKGGAY